MSRTATLLLWFSLASASIAAFSACGSASGAPDSEELMGAPEKPTPQHAPSKMSAPASSILIATANVNLRRGPSTSDAILHVIPLGAKVTLLDPKTKNGFYNVKHNGTAGWSFAEYFEEPSATSTTSSSASGTGGAGGAGGGGAPSTSEGPHDDAIARAAEGMGFSYWWGHGRFLPEGPSSSNAGTCTGSCPSCSHTGTYGGDCSGLVAKVWQVPSSNMDVSIDSHPYSTATFAVDSAEWSTISRDDLQVADALVYNTNGEGHIFIFNGGDGWGSMDAYECKGCSYGCVHDLRTVTSAYHAIRRAGY